MNNNSKSYTIEGDIDFYKELYDSLDDPDNQQTEEVCLISNMPLSENYVELECHHKFNYLPLFKDIYNHKTKFNSLEVSHLRIHELRCPYCRNKQSKLLPFHENMGVEQVHGVNWISEEILTTKAGIGMKNGNCCWDGYECHTHNVVMNGTTGLNYCYIHFKIVSKQIIKEKREEARLAKLKDKKHQKEKLKKELNQQKEISKQQLKHAKEILKQQIKEEKALAKSIKIFKLPPTCNENVIISMNNIENIDMKCSAILKHGLRKGEECGAKGKINGYCLRHSAKL